jgi:O-glycosyl hydrolase
MDGFGATHNSLEYQGVGSTLSPELRLQAVEAVYQQVGLNLGNLEGALLESPGSYDERSNDNDDPDSIDWAGFQTFPADAIHSNLLALAEPFGFNDYFINQKVNLRWASPWMEDLRTTDYARYLEEAAEQVAAGSIYWRDQYGIVPRYLMLFNEPLSGNGELQSGSVQEVVDLVIAVGTRLEQEGFGNVRFVLPNEETVDKSLEVADAILSDPVARRFAGPIGYHSYPYGSPYTSIPYLLNTSGVGTPDPNSVAVRDRLRQLSQQYDLSVWMTEVSHGEVDPTSYDDFRGRAIHIHDELVYAHASAYFGMNNMWDTLSQQAHFGNQNLFDNSSEGTIVLIDNNLQKVYITGMGYAIGHFARWVKAGAIRVEALSGDALLQVTAFRSPDSTQLIMVIINNQPAPKEIQVEVKAAEMTGNISGEQSTASQYWAPLQGIPSTSPDGFIITLPALSVTTLALPLNPN